ncbi:hypothetical protein CPAR01_11286 [Colletotrichum paranaense]|uniref:Uncharacterized protein n=1 Tax=Colletotrichum paranaense TaxID=1914294 RepID=A0ABQ9SB79_9PEZI|nr:uncharacterized protein CPAR01_11286 [Colletotrichum paranaense]KAK1531637.1 hypothetical protein CPAR01_11286 [Colletotrichum paranaense]
MNWRFASGVPGSRRHGRGKRADWTELRLLLFPRPRDGLCPMRPCTVLIEQAAGQVDPSTPL